MYIRFDKVDNFIRAYGRTRPLELFGPEKYDAIYNIIRYPTILCLYILCL